MNVGDFRRMTKDLPDDYDIKVKIDPRLIPEGCQEVEIIMNRGQNPIGGAAFVAKKHVRVTMTITPVAPKEAAT